MSTGRSGVYAHTGNDAIYSPGLLVAYGLRNQANVLGALISGRWAKRLREVQAFVVNGTGWYD